MDPLLWQILLQVVHIFLNAVFASAEIAVISFNANKLAQMAKDGNKKAKRLVKLTDQPAKFLSTIQVAITLSGFLGSAFAADTFSEKLVNWASQFNLPVKVSVLDSVSVIVITIILSYFTLVFGELVPKRLAMKKTEKVAFGVSGLMAVCAKIFAPIVWILTKSTNVILRLFGIDPNAEDNEVTEEEIRLMVDAGTESGNIDLDEQEIITNVFEFDNITAGEVATHRTEISFLWVEESDEEWEETIFSSRHSLYPVCDESVDNVVGVLNTKDYFRLRDKSRENVMKEAVRPANFVPENARADVLFERMKHSRDHFAVVLDEYGGMTGIVTINDLLEELVGDIDDEFEDKPEEEIKKVDSETWAIGGNVSIEDVEDALGIDIDDQYDSDTFGGFIFGVLGTIPEDGTQVELQAEGLNIKVTEIAEHRVVKALVCFIDPPKEEEDEEE
ncbi:MAG: HlyC/CorC family transporter [Clostridia bacterium]|nr:HlyC/CorC family transporter [Clostridia bacterium]